MNQYKGLCVSQTFFPAVLLVCSGCWFLALLKRDLNVTTVYLWVTVPFYFCILEKKGHVV